MRTRIFTLLVAFLAIAGNAVWGQETSWTGEGTGTPEDPYQISTPDELKAFRDLVNGGDADACAILTADIDLEGNSENPWTPIRYISQGDFLDILSYTGTFDGDGHTISGLYISDDEKNYGSGLFGVVGVFDVMDMTSTGSDGSLQGVIKNLTVKGNFISKGTSALGGICAYNVGTIQHCTNEITTDISFSGKGNVGGICANNFGIITACVNNGTIQSSTTAGGICAMNSGTIEQCYNAGEIKGNSNIGGISGEAGDGYESVIKNCYNSGNITFVTPASDGASRTASGICCILQSMTSKPTQVEITNCHNYGKISGEVRKAGICTVPNEKLSDRIEVTVSNSYYLESTAEAGFLYVSNVASEAGTSNDQPGLTESKTETEFADGTVLYLLQSGNPGDDKVWEQTIGTDKYPVFDASDTPSVVYQVTVQPNDAAMGTTTGGGVYVANEEATVTATSNEDYEFINWTIGEEEQSTETTYTFEVTASVTLIANFQKIDEGGEDEPGDDDQGDTGIHKPQRPIKYYNIYIDTICPGLNVEVSKDVVQEGHQVSAYLTIQAECDTTGMRFEYKRGLFGYWKDLKELEGVQPGEYIIKNIYTDIYIRALDATLPEEEPTGIEDVEGAKAYAKEGSIYVYTPNREEVTIISMSGTIIKHAEQVGLQSYNVSRGIYIVRIGEKVFKLKN